MRILTEQKDAEDAVQNAFMQVIKHFEKVSEISCEELPFWLISITKNEALMIRRKNQRVTTLENWDAFAETTDSNMDYHAVVALFTRLPETYRAVLEMKLLLGYSDREIAQHLGITEAAVSTRQVRPFSSMGRLQYSASERPERAKYCPQFLQMRTGCSRFTNSLTK